VEAWKEEVLAGYRNQDRPFLVGHRGSQYTQLPARDGIAHGKIKRSNRFPNCSFFSNWTAPEEKITWDVEVSEEGAYEVEIYYACAEKELGSMIELSFNGDRVQGRVTEAHDPPLRGGEHDRVKRVESYVKDFKPMKLGILHLGKGRGELTLRALTVAGANVMDFRLLMLKRVGAVIGDR